MEHMSKFLQVGPSNVVFSQIRFIQPNNDWFSLQRLKAVEAKLSETLESRLEDINSLKPGALDTVNGDMTMENVKVTYNLRKRTALPRHVVQMQAPNKPRHVDGSICRYNDYGGTFVRKNVVRAELVVVIRRLTASELAKQLGVSESQASQSTTSGYFRDEAATGRPTTPHEKAAIRRLLNNKEQKKRQRVRSSSDSENIDSANELPKPDTRPQQKKPALGSASQQVPQRMSLARTVSPTRSSQPQVGAVLSKAQVLRHEQPQSLASTSAPEVRTPSEDAKSKTKSARDQGAKTLTSHGSHSSRSGSGHSSRSSSLPRDREAKQTLRADSRGPESEDLVERQTTERQAANRQTADRQTADRQTADRQTADRQTADRQTADRQTADRQTAERQTSRPKQTSEKQSTQRSKSSRDHKPSKHSKDDGRRPHKENASHGHRHDSKREKSSHRDEGSSSKRRKGDHTAIKPKKESHSTKNVALKQLLTVCGIGDSDSDSEAETLRKEDKMETVRTSPDSTQTTVETKAKRESMDDFKEHRATTVAASKKSSASGKQKREAETLNRSLFLELDENEDPRSSPNVGSSAVSEPSENFKLSAGVKSSASTGPSVESTLSAHQEYDPASPQVPQDPPKLRAVSYNPTPVTSVAVEYTPTKAAVGSSVLERKVAPTVKEDTYVPSTTRARVRLEGPSYVPSAMTSLPKQEEKPKRREEYVPSSVASTTSSSRSVRGRYEEYVPEAVGSASRRHQTTVDYVPTPKREAATASGDVPTTTSTLPLSEVPEARYRVGGNTNNTQESSGRSNSILDQEIRTASEVKDLEEKHLKYLFDKCLPEMDGIIRRKIESWRNADYHRGGKAKRSLTYKVYFSMFSSAQMNLISNLFIEEFVVRRRLSGDYLNQVLIPEFLIRVVSANKGTTHQESDELMASIPFELFNIPLH
ncbi:zinc finger CCCH domain-containing protein 13 [Ixodes scapularis]|nr:zinc finger CCCH domain-containing protein 13 [Ixodes scapularis]